MAQRPNTQPAVSHVEVNDQLFTGCQIGLVAGDEQIVGGEVRGRHVQRHWRHGLDAQNFASRRAGEFHPAHVATQPERVTATDA